MQRCLLVDYLASRKLVIACEETVINRRGYDLDCPAERRLRQPLAAFSAWIRQQARTSEPAAAP